MAKQLTAYLPDGETPASVVNWPQIDAGDPSTARAFVVRNTGTETITSPVLSIVADATSDADEMARIGLDPTGTADPETVTLGTGPLALGTMEPLDERVIVVNWIVPSGAPALTGLRRFRLRVQET